MNFATALTNILQKNHFLTIRMLLSLYKRICIGVTMGKCGFVENNPRARRASLTTVGRLQINITTLLYYFGFVLNTNSREHDLQSRSQLLFKKKTRYLCMYGYSTCYVKENI